MITSEIKTIKKLTGVDDNQIYFSDDGFLSRGYVIDKGRLVFKFRKYPDVTYTHEIRNLDYLNRQDMGVNLQSVAFKTDDDSYLGIYGVSGLSLERWEMDDVLRVSVGQQLGGFLRKLHKLEPEAELVYPLDDLIRAWQGRYAKAGKTLEKYFNSSELARIDALMTEEMPDVLRKLGENRVFSHGDLGDGNVFVDEDGKVGVIDFNESGYMDEASDFMDITDDRLCRVMLDAYGADENLRKKVEMQRRIRPIIVLDVYADRDEAMVRQFVGQIRERFDL